MSSAPAKPTVSAAVIAPCTLAAARYAVTHWHYSATMPMPPLVRYGAWEHGAFIGAILFGRGASPYLGTRFALNNTELAELVRVALHEHTTPVSQIVAAAVRALHAHSPGLRLLVSFADPAHGHHGGIYQAMNWVYTGQTTPERGYQDAAGKLHHQRVVSPSGWVTQYGRRSRGVPQASVIPVQLPGKHRYVLPLDSQMRRRVARMALPYPSAV